MTPLLLLLLTASAEPVWHPISITEADVYVTRDHATVRLKMFAEDLYLFHDIEGDDNDVISADQLRQAMEDHKQFLAERFIIRDAAGERIPGRLTNMQPFEIPPEGIETGDLMNHSLMYQFEYKFSEAPEFLTFEQNIADANFLYPSEMQLALKQAGSEAVYSVSLKPGQPHTPPRFDWTNPPLSDEASQKEWDDWFSRQREQSLGITSYSSVYSFIYITDYEVRHEILVPLVTLASIFDIERRDPSWLDIDEQEAARAAIRKYFGTGNPVTIDGVVVQPVFDRIDFYSLDLRDFAMQAPAKGTPARVEVKWDKFSPALLKVKSVIFAFDEVLKTRFSRFSNNNTWVWENPGRTPRPEIHAIAAALPARPALTLRPVAWTSLGAGLVLFLGLVRRVGSRRAGGVLVVAVCLAGATWSQTKTIASPFSKPAPLPAADAQAVLETLHRNVYRAFDYGTEDEVYDALAATVSGQLLKEVYLSVRESLEVRDQGGALARIREVVYGPGEVVHDESVPWPGFRYRASWTVSGTVEHWGHIHERVNQFEGIFTVELDGGQWKISDFDVTGETQVRSRTRLRKF